MKVAVLGLDTLSLGKTVIADDRFDKLKEIFKPAKLTPAQLEFVDQSGIPNAYAIACTKEKLLDLIINDLELTEMRLSMAKDAEEKEILEAGKALLDKEEPLCRLNLPPEKLKLISSYNLLTLKSVVILREGISAPKEEVASKVFKELNWILFFTVNEKELRAWPIKSGTTAYEAAGEIHSEIQRGFIKAEIISFNDLVKAGGINQAKAAGKMQLQDKDYQISDGDIVVIRCSK